MNIVRASIFPKKTTFEIESCSLKHKEGNNQIYYTTTNTTNTSTCRLLGRNTGGHKVSRGLREAGRWPGEVQGGERVVLYLDAVLSLQPLVQRQPLGRVRVARRELPQLVIAGAGRRHTELIGL